MALPTLDEYLQADKYQRGRIRKLYKEQGVAAPHAGFGRKAVMKGEQYPPDHPMHQTRPYRHHFKDPLLRAQHFAYNKMKAQAAFRREDWALTLQDYFDSWLGSWHMRGRGGNDLVMTRIDSEFPWRRGNVEIIPRYEHIRRVAALRRGIPTKCR